MVIALKLENFGRHGQIKRIEFRITGRVTKYKNSYTHIMVDYILHINGRGGSGKTTLIQILNEKL